MYPRLVTFFIKVLNTFVLQQTFFCANVYETLFYTNLETTVAEKCKSVKKCLRRKKKMFQAENFSNVKKMSQNEMNISSVKNILSVKIFRA